MERAEVNGTNLEYQATGAGEPVLMISTGPIADSFYPLRAQQALADRYRLITYRQRRPRSSSNGATPVSFAEHAADAAALLAHLGVGRAHVAGHSTGAAIALQLAVDHPDVVQSLALLEPPLLIAPSGAAFFASVGPAVAAYESGDGEDAMARFLSVVSSLEWRTCKRTIQERVPGGVERALRTAGDFFEGYLPALNGWTFGAEQAGAISQPALSVHGTRTNQLFVDSNALLRRWLPQLEDHSVEGVGHLLHIERPEPVAEGIAEFLARHPC